MDIQVERPTTARPEDLQPIADLLGSVFDKERDWVRELPWQYLENPCGPAWYVNARDQESIVGHYAVIPGPEISIAKYRHIRTFVSLNTAVHPKAQGKGLFQACAAALYRHLAALHPTLILGVANANSVKGFVNYLGFYNLGRLTLKFLLPWQTPRSTTDRLLSSSVDLLSWRARRPGTRLVKDVRAGTVSRLIRHKGFPIESVLAHGLPSELLTQLDVPTRGPLSVPVRLYATSEREVAGGIPVPERLRPSPLHFICRVMPETNASTIVNLVTSRRFEFLDFDVQ